MSHMDIQTDRRMVRSMDRQDGQVNGQMDGQVDGQTDGQVIIFLATNYNLKVKECVV